MLTESERSADPKVRPRKPWNGWRKHDFSGPELVSKVKQDRVGMTSAFEFCPTLKVDIDLGEAGAAGQEMAHDHTHASTLFDVAMLCCPVAQHSHR